MEIKEKIDKCLGCNNGNCRQYCPLGNNISQMIKYSKENKLDLAYKELLKTSVMPNVLSRICPHTCQIGCIRNNIDESVHIRDIEKYITQNKLSSKEYINILKQNIEENLKQQNLSLENIDKITSKKQVSIIGARPSGITCSIYLKLYGFDVKLLDKQERLGGLLRYGIPSFRLDKCHVDFLEDVVKELGIDFVSKEIKQEEIRNINSDYLVIATGLKKGIIPTQFKHLKNNVDVFDATSWLINQGVYEENNQINEEKNKFNNKSCLIIGGGNVAIDTALTLNKYGANVNIIYRRSKELMPAEKELVSSCENNHITILENTDIDSAHKFEDGKYITTVYKTNKTLNRKEKAIKIPNSDFQIMSDFIFFAIGSKSDLDIDMVLKQDNIYLIGDIAGINQSVATASFSRIKLANKILHDLT